jgi:hypothetical protein
MNAECHDVDVNIVEGEIQRSPFRIRAWTNGQDVIEIDGFSEEHSLNDVARWVIAGSRVDGEELLRILGEMLGE